MAYWLVKTEPSGYSYADLERDGSTTWSGVKNNQALIHLRAMRKGDRVLVYHTGNEKKLAGIAEVVADPFPDPAAGNSRIVVVDLAPREAIAGGATLEQIRRLKEFSTFDLVRISRLSVMPVSATRWKKLLAMSH